MIIGITGTLGAGKGTVVEYLKTKGFVHYSARDIWNEEIARRGLVSNRDTMVEIANDMRRLHGAEYFAKRALEKAKENGGDAVIESIRTPAEAELIKQNGGVIWAVDADINTRYERIVGRQSETDQITFEKFVEDEKREFTNPDPTKQNISGVMQIADATLTNNTTPEALCEQVEQALDLALE
jgi:dephospho-CoA kinase